jgi:hypothetical protein
MEAERTVLTLAHASDALVSDHDTAGALANLLESCQGVLASDASGILSGPPRGKLELLAASTHKASDLELHQAQIDEGPCVDARDGNESVAVVGEEALVDRWPSFGEAMVKAGYHAVHSAPLRWHANTLGAMALFRRDPVPFSAEDDTVAQAFANIATLLIVHAEPVDLDRLGARVEAALSSRVVVEQAKGVLAHHGDVAMDEAYEVLRELAVSRGTTLTHVARAVLGAAARGVDPI